MTDPSGSYSNGSPEKHSSSAVFVVAFICLESLVLIQAFLAYEDRFLTVSQMRQRGIDQGLPFAWHFAMWSDLVIISPLAAYLIGQYHRRWSLPSMLASLAIGLVSSGFLHWLYSHSGMPEAHVQNHALTAAGMVHAIYMCIAFSVFLQFFLFTQDVAPRVLGVVSVLLLIHVFIGTHMVLGILNIAFPQDWYPGQPLRSILGWATIVALAAGVLWRNRRDIVSREVNITEGYERVVSHPIARGATALVEFWTLQKLNTTENYLKTLDYIASYFGFGWFLSVFTAKVQRATAFKGGIFLAENWISFIENTALPCVLIIVFGTVYAFSRQSVRLELSIGPKVFPHDRVPKEWGGPAVRVIIPFRVFRFILIYIGPTERVTIFFRVIVFLGLYIALIWFADNIKIASLIMFILACNDWRTRYQIEEGMGNYFEMEKYAPKPTEKDYDVIQERRKIVRKFLFDKPHRAKETGRVAGCGLAVLISMIGYLYSANWLYFAAYFVLIATMIINEVIAMRWRFEMYQKLKGML